MGNGHRRRDARKFFRLPLRFHLLLVFLALATAIALVMGTEANRQSYAALDDTVTVAFDSAAKASLDGLEEITASAKRAAAALVRYHHGPVFNPDEKERSVEALVTVLETVPAISAAYLGWQNGDFLLVRPVGANRQLLNAPGKGEWLIQLVSGEKSRFEFLDKSLALIEQREPVAYAFDPRTRPWFQKASESESAILTAAYRFFTTGEPGFSAAQRSSDGAVAGVDISLWDLSGRLPTVSIAPSSRIAVIDTEGGVLAYSNPSALHAIASDIQRPFFQNENLPDIGTLNDPVLDHLAQRMRHEPSMFEGQIQVDGRVWMARVDQLEGSPAYFYMAVPLDELRAAPGLLRERLFQFFALTVFFSVFAVWFAAGRLSRPLEGAASEIRQLATLELQDRPKSYSEFSELDDLTRSISTVRVSLAAYTALHRTIIEQRDDPAILAGVLDCLLMISASNHGAAWIYKNDDAPEIVVSTLPDIPVETLVSLGHGVIGKVMAANDPFIVSGAEFLPDDGEFSPLREKRLLGVPLKRSDGQPIGGFLAVVAATSTDFLSPLLAFARFAAHSSELVLDRRGLLLERNAAHAETELILARVADGIHVLAGDGTVMRQNPAAMALLGYPDNEALGRSSHELIHHHRADGSIFPVTECSIYQTLKDGRTRIVNDEVFFRKGGTSFPVEYECSALFDEAGHIRGAVVSFRDVTARREEQLALRERMKELRCLYHVQRLTLDPQASAMKVCTEIADTLVNSLLHVNLAVARICLDAEDYYAPGWELPATTLRASIFGVRGEIGFVEVGYHTLPPGTADEDRAWLPEERAMIEAVAADISRLIQNQHLAEMLRQSERLSAIGELTGGIAHDFNNLLTVVLGSAEMLLDGPCPEDEARQLIGNIKTAAGSGKELTAQLLAFARRQTLQPQVVNVNNVLGDLEQMISRSIGSGIDFEMRLVPDIWPTRLDPAQLQNAILNLCINARDAMPNGGKLTIEVENITLKPEQAEWESDFRSGNYILMTISDTGTGIPEEAISRVFEPFFTTKPIGKGSGLGLSMVYGFTKQSGGQIRIESEPGLGTTVKLYFPYVPVVADVASAVN